MTTFENMGNLTRSEHYAMDKVALNELTFEARKTVASVCGRAGTHELESDVGRKWVADWLRRQAPNYAKRGRYGCDDAAARILAVADFLERL